MSDVGAQAAFHVPLDIDALGGAGVSIEPARAAEIHRRVIELTKALFPGEPRIDLVRDPEFGDWAYSVSVHASGDVQELLALSDRWHYGLLDAAEELASIYCLSLVPSDESH